MKTSVVMAIYNGNRYIEEQMDSIYRQTVRPNEVCFYDDGSTDDTLSIIRNYIKTHNLEEEWKVAVNQKNKGYAKNFIDAACKVDGDIIFFCDQDDIWLEDRIEVMSRVLIENSDIDLLCSNLEPFYVSKDTRKWSKKDLRPMKNNMAIDYPSITPTNFHLQRSGCTMCVRKEFVHRVNPYWVEHWAHDDFVWKMAMANRSCAIIQYISMKRRMHNNNATVIRERTRDWRIKQLSDTDRALKSLKSYFQDNKMIDDLFIPILEKNIKSIEIRKKVVLDKSVISWMRLLLKYRDCYPRIKGLYLDLYLAFFGTYKGV